MTLAGVATGSLPDSEVHSPLTDLVWPRVLAGGVTNNWGQVAGLLGWRGLVPLAALDAMLAAWACGWRRSVGALVVAGWCLVAIARLNRDYLEYSEGYYLYLGSRLAAGARLYADTASTQPPLLPLLIGALWRIQPDVWLPRLLALGCYALAALLAGRLAARLVPTPLAGPPATALAALLPLGAAAPQVLDANAVLAPLAVALALLWVRAVDQETAGARATLLAGVAGALAALGLATKLTFAPFVVAPLLAALSPTPKIRALARPPTPGRERRGLKPPATPAKPPQGGSWWPTYPQGASASFADVAGAFMPRRSLPRRRFRLLPQAAARAAHLPVAYTLALTLSLLAQVAYWRVASGPRAADAIFGELDNPLHPAGALLALVQLVYLEGVPLALAALGWWGLWRGQRDPALRWFGLAAALLPLFAVHQGTFVGVVRPAEPFMAAFAVAGLYAGAQWLRCKGQPALRRQGVVGLAGLAAVLMPGAWSAEQLLATRTVSPEVVLAPLVASTAPERPVLAPPYYAALAGRTMLFDYPDWTVWGMRAAAGAPRERELTSRAVDLLNRQQMPVVAADFRLAYIDPLAGALARNYSVAGADGDDPARAVTLWVPK